MASLTCHFVNKSTCCGAIYLFGCCRFETAWNWTKLHQSYHGGQVNKSHSRIRAENNYLSLCWPRGVVSFFFNDFSWSQQNGIFGLKLQFFLVIICKSRSKQYQSFFNLKFLQKFHNDFEPVLQKMLNGHHPDDNVGKQIVEFSALRTYSSYI